jgi:alpha-beta hydrolase superfamily lysophospholipase
VGDFWTPDDIAEKAGAFSAGLRRIHRRPMTKLPLGLAVLLTAISVVVGFSLAPPAQAAPRCSPDGEFTKRLNLPVYEWSDPDKPRRGTIVALHGLTFYAAAFDDVASYLAEQGYDFFAIDMRGFGRWRQENSKFGGDNLIHFTQTSEDALKLLQTLRHDRPKEKLFAMGESLGANVALDLVSRNPGLCDGVILGSPCYKAKIHPKVRWTIDIVKGLRHPNKRLDLTPYITPYLSHSKALTRDCLKDRRICRSLSPVELIKAEKTNKFALLNVDKLPPTYPVLVIAGEKDAVFKTSSLSELLKKFGSHDLDINIFPKKGHLLIEHQAVMPEIADTLDRWLTVQTTDEKVAKLPQLPQLPQQ